MKVERTESEPGHFRSSSDPGVLSVSMVGARAIEPNRLVRQKAGTPNKCGVYRKRGLAFGRRGRGGSSCQPHGELDATSSFGAWLLAFWKCDSRGLTVHTLDMYVIMQHRARQQPTNVLIPPILVFSTFHKSHDSFEGASAEVGWVWRSSYRSFYAPRRSNVVTRGALLSPDSAFLYSPLLRNCVQNVNPNLTLDTNAS